MVDDDPAMGNGEFVHTPLNLDIQFPLLETPILPSLRHVFYLRNGLMRRWGFGRHAWGIWMRGRKLRLLLCDQQEFGDNCWEVGCYVRKSVT